MHAMPNADTEALLMEVHAARFLSLSVRTLQAWRIKGCGPAYVQAGRAIRYRRCDLVSWVNDHVVASARAGAGVRGRAMSFHAVLWACEQDLAPVSKLVLVVLSTFASKNDGSCFPKVATIAQMASVSARTVHRKLPELAEKQLVRVERNFKGKARLPHKYWLACGGDQRSRVKTQTRSVMTGYDNGGSSNNHYQNHYIDRPTQAPRVGQAPLARQGSKKAAQLVSAISEVDQAAQVELARRLGMSGWEILCAFEDEVSHLCFLLRKNVLTDAHLSELRRRYVALMKQQSKGNQ